MSKEAKTPAAPKAQPAISMDPKFIGRLTGTLLGICAVVALLLGITNYARSPSSPRCRQKRPGPPWSGCSPRRAMRS